MDYEATLERDSAEALLGVLRRLDKERVATSLQLAPGEFLLEAFPLAGKVHFFPLAKWTSSHCMRSVVALHVVSCSIWNVFYGL